MNSTVNTAISNSSNEQKKTGHEELRTVMEMKPFEEQFDTLPIPPAKTLDSAEPMQPKATCETADYSEEDDETEPTVKSALSIQEEDERRTVHEAAENKRKAEWEARQKAKKDADQEALRLISNLSEDALIAASVKKIADDTERLTRRNMKHCVMEWIQTKCLDDPAFARMAMHPEKTMINCFHYISRKAKDYVLQEMKDNDIPQRDVYGSDIPDDLCYLWAEQYFQDVDAEEDRKKEEPFVARPYISTISIKNEGNKKANKKSAASSQIPKKEIPRKENIETKETVNLTGQMSLFDLQKGGSA